MIQTGILELSVTISRRAALLEGSSDDPAHSSDDLAALAWIQRSLEDVEATINWTVGGKTPPFCSVSGSCPFFCRKPGFLGSAGAPAVWIKAPVDHAGGAAAHPVHAKGIWRAQSTYHRPQNKDS